MIGCDYCGKTEVKLKTVFEFSMVFQQYVRRGICSVCEKERSSPWKRLSSNKSEKYLL